MFLFLYGALFLSEIIKKPIFDCEGEVLERVKDIIVVEDDPLPQISTIITERKKKLFVGCFLTDIVG